MGDDLIDRVDLRGRIRSHPFVAASVGAFLGFLGGPLVLRGIQRALAITSGVSSPAAPKSTPLPGLVLASLRIVRARL